MKNTIDLTKLAFLATIAGIFAAASTHADDKTNYITAKEITAMPPCTVTFAKRLSEFSGFFTSANGRTFVLGNIRGEQWVWHFVGAVKEGQAYKFPDAFLNYQAAPHYVTAKEIAAMAPCTAVLASRTPCSSYFTTADGKWFGIGDPGSGAQVSHFIWSLKDGETNKFPDAFLDYQVAPHYFTAKEIAAMAPCTATLVRGWDDSGYFKTANGKGFFIGDERSGEDVDRFLRTLEEKKTYAFPDAFLKYQKNQPTTKP
jgi:hypothetical protein